MNKTYDLLLVGATALSAGIVRAHPELSIAILENTCSVAGEFANTYLPETAFSYSPKTPYAQELKEEFLKRKALSPSAPSFPAIMPILSDGLNRSTADVFFFAVLTDIQAQKDGYQVQWSAFGIPHSFRALHIIDTTATFISHPFFTGKAPRYAMALCHIDTDLHIHTTPCCDAAQGRASILRQYRNILRIAPEPAITPLEPAQTFGCAAWLPSASERDFLSAFDRGAAASLPEGEYFALQPVTVDEGSYDIIVVGLGTAGTIAAITASRNGHKVLGIENLSLCGGAGTAGNVAGYYFGYKGGIYQEIDDASHRFDDRFLPMRRVGVDQKIAQLNEALSECDVRYNAAFTQAIFQGRTVTGISWHEKGVRHTAKAKFVIDATAEAAVCISAGCNMLGGRTSDGQFQPYSCIHLKYTDGNLLSGSMDQGRMNQYDPDSLGQSILQTYACYLHLREDYSSMEYMGIVPLFGLREGLRIQGEETVEFSKVTAGQFCEKPVYWCWSNFDNHGKDNALESEDYQDWVTLCGMWGWGLSLPVPMGALIPKDFDGLLVAGRCVSADHDTAFALRMKDDVQKSGEAAAQLASLAISGNIRAKDVHVDILRQRLFASGCLKPEDEIPRLEKQRMNELHEGQLWCRNDADIRAGLGTDAPAYFMWSARVLQKRQLLTKLLDSADEKTRFHSALALSMLPEPSEKAVEQLSLCALKQDGYIPGSGRKYVYPRSISAIYALGRTKAASALPALYQLMEDENFLDTLPFTPDMLLQDRKDYYFQYRSHILSALCRIAQVHPEKRAEIRDRLQAYLPGKQFSVSLIGGDLRFDDTDTFRKMAKNI